MKNYYSLTPSTSDTSFRDYTEPESLFVCRPTSIENYNYKGTWKNIQIDKFTFFSSGIITVYHFGWGVNVPKIFYFTFSVVVDH